MEIIKYKPWQYESVELLTKQCVDREGLLLYHGTGTGKTVTSIGIIKNLGKPYIILCPEQVVNQWNIRYVKKYKKYLPECVEIITYKNYEKISKYDVSKYNLIVDEGQNLIKIMREGDIQVSQNLLSTLNSFDKKIILSATPILNNHSDIGYFIYIITGNGKMVPTDPFSFEKKFYKINKGHSIIMGWFLPIVIDIRKIFVKLTSFSIGIVAVKNSVDSIKNLASKSKNLEDAGRKIKKLLVPTATGYKTIFKPILGFFYSNGVKISKSNKSKSYSEKELKIIQPEDYTDTNLGSPLSLCAPNESVYDDLEKAGGLFGGMASVLWVTSFVIKSIYNVLPMPWEKKFKSFDPKKFIDSGATKYITYYNVDTDEKENEEEIKDKNKKEGRRNFPKVKKSNIDVSYESNQMDRFIRFAYNQLEIGDYVQLGIMRNSNSIVTFDPQKTENFLNFGRLLGNYCPVLEKGELKVIYPGDLIVYDKSKMCYKFVKNSYEIITSPKFETIILDITRNKKRHAIYSNFTISSSLLSAILTQKKIENYYIHNQENEKNYNSIMKKFYGKKDSVLVLDTDYYEGISLDNVDNLHILEPCLDNYKQKQLEGRNVRLGSYDKDYKVYQNVYLSSLGIINYKKSKMKQYMKENTYKWYSSMTSTHEDGITPDAYVLRTHGEASEAIKKTNEIFIKKEDKKTKLDGCKKIECNVTEINELSTNESCGK